MRSELAEAEIERDWGVILESSMEVLTQHVAAEKNADLLGLLGKALK